MKDEIRAAIRKMKLGKVTDPDSMSVELLEALKYYGIVKLLISQHYSTKSIPQVRFHQTSSNLHLHRCLRNMEEQGVNYKERSFLRVISPKYFPQTS